ncbi:hypothetical protein EDD18DRAFT_1116170 [Armillaria luteobubalina]|uniref:Uncharacterized protein n=1 Tax=Armillaria luteobubalina TaxID=153913 RepID=A0AA39P0D0_9AGAR|nr:hypothetical protein EDD18DRAFT_1116170 [Armillaria luteobubalina]
MSPQGTGKTATRIARLLQDINQPVLLTLRKGVLPGPFKGAKFDGHYPSTFENVFTIDLNIDPIYLVAPAGSSEVFPPMKPFIDLAVKKDVNRFVLLSALTDEKSHNTDHILTGSELLSYDDVSVLLSSDVLRRKITHTRITSESLKTRYPDFGIDDGYVGLSALVFEDLNANSVEEK